MTPEQDPPTAPTAAPAPTAPETRSLGVVIFGWRLDIERQVYATVVLMSVLVVYDGWQELATFLGVALVLLAPMLALAVAHFFAEVLDAHARLRRPLTGKEWRHQVRHQVPVFLSSVPPLLVLAVGWKGSLDARTTIQALLWTGVATLVVLTSIAGWHAGLRGWRWLLASVSGGAAGLIVISLQVLLKPH